jgi:hypothetical protein
MGRLKFARLAWYAEDSATGYAFVAFRGEPNVQ